MSYSNDENEKMYPNVSEMYPNVFKIILRIKIITEIVEKAKIYEKQKTTMCNSSKFTKSKGQQQSDKNGEGSNNKNQVPRSAMSYARA